MTLKVPDDKRFIIIIMAVWYFARQMLKEKYLG